MALVLYHDIYRCTGNIENPKNMVVVHGWGMHGIVWDDIMPRLLEKFHVTVVDLPGMGRSPLPGGEYNLDYLTEHILNVAPDKAVWLGWSLGGTIAMNVAIRYPERVCGLITVASSPCFVATPRWPMAISGEILQGFADLLVEDWEGTLIRFLALQCKGSLTLKEDIRKLKDIVYFCGLPAPQALRGALEVLRATDLLDQLSAIACPTLHVYGERDNLVPVGVSTCIRDYQPDAELAVIKGVSHVPFLSEPDLFVQSIVDFLKEYELIR